MRDLDKDRANGQNDVLESLQLRNVCISAQKRDVSSQWMSGNSSKKGL